MAVCELCGEPLPPGEEMFNYHGFSGPCPKPPIKKEPQPDLLDEAVELLRAVRRGCNCGYDYLCSACQAAINASRFVSRYDAAQQEQNDA